MKSYKYFLCLLLLTVQSVLSAQSSVQLAATAFASANYDDAAQLYDMAASLSTGSERSQLFDMAKKSRTCKSLSRKAEGLYNQDDVNGALKVYTELAGLNPNDKTAVARKRKLESIVAKNKAAAMARREQERLFKKTLNSFGEHSVEAYVRKYPDSAESAFLTSVQKCLEGVAARGPLCDSAAFYKKSAEIFLANGNKEKAYEFYDMAASVGDSYGLYQTALKYDKDSPQYMTLIVMAAESGSSDAMNLARSIPYDPEVAKRYIRALSSYWSTYDLKSLIYLNENREGLFVKYLPQSHDLTSHPILSGSREEMEKVDGHVLYWLAQNAERLGHKSLYSKLLWAAVRKGNVEAMSEYSPLLDVAGREALNFCVLYCGILAGDANLEYAEVLSLYGKYIKTGILSADEAWKLYLGEWRLRDIIKIDKHEKLAYTCLMADSEYTFKCFNRYWKSASKLEYDAEFLNRLAGILQSSSSDNKYVAKVIKKLSKAKTGAQYNSQLKKFAEAGLMDQGSHYANPGAIEYPVRSLAQVMNDKLLISKMKANGGKWKWTKERSYGTLGITLEYISDNKFLISFSGELNKEFLVYLKDGALRADNDELRKQRLNSFYAKLSQDRGNLLITGAISTTAYSTCSF